MATEGLPFKVVFGTLTLLCLSIFKILSSHSSWSFPKYPQPGVQLQVLCRGHHYQLLHIRTVSQVPCETVDYPGYLKCWINQCKSWCLWLGLDCHWYGLFIVVPDNDIRYYSLKRTVIWSPLKTMMMWSVNEGLRRRGQNLNPRKWIKPSKYF